LLGARSSQLVGKTKRIDPSFLRGLCVLWERIFSFL
jgi:hypothetical protein